MGKGINQPELFQISIVINHMRKAACLLSLAFSPLLLDGTQEIDTRRHAICILYPLDSKAMGLASFSQDSIQSPVKVVCSVKGLNPNSKHGLHIYEYGDPTVHIGKHFNPKNKNHGSPLGEQAHAGDLGNLQADPFGSAYMCFVHKLITLYGENSILGRTVAISSQDDFGRTNHPQSKQNGNSGKPIASGVIGLSKQFKTVPPFTV